MKRLFNSLGEKDTDIFKMEPRHYGIHNRDKTLYYIEEDNGQLGFFAMYRCWLEYLYFADVCGYIPVVNAGKLFAYREDVAINGTGNPFEYYFHQPSFVSLAEAKSSYSVVRSDLVHRKMVELVFTGEFFSYKSNKRYLHEMSRIVNKYVQFNDYTKKYIDQGIKSLEFIKDKTLGVHIRGTDFRGNYNNHPIYVTEDECFKVIDSMMEGNQYCRIFLATDDQRILNQFVRRYGDDICFYSDVVRSEKNKSVAFCDHERKNHKFLLGLEVIRDMYTLSACDGLIAGISQIPICARINKLSRNERYKDIRIIDKGLNRNGRIFTT